MHCTASRWPTRRPMYRTTRHEFAWDVRTLQAANAVTDERAAQAEVAGPVADSCPSLHLNLGEDCRKIGDLPAARRHLELGQVAAVVVGGSGARSMTSFALTSGRHVVRLEPDSLRGTPGEPGLSSAGQGADPVPGHFGPVAELDAEVPKVPYNELGGRCLRKRHRQLGLHLAGIGVA